ncbi:MBL fold metallo-hydrolase [Reichenbachiella agarivorans]|uniref:MBL fold metallo-hydrolase n=1 Tax=Reichenbachiella agarivorans TaxID=2979464 RepID=A0ABY6CVT8_9BACT|nr:MBL fold metallo-hydrolase [Reichenbachiella agarivorans]UXP32370.1 MBL fold metallo-hydrolase [Reichenbachiella agarivorans]
MYSKYPILIIALLLVSSLSIQAQTVTYLGNEGMLIEYQGTKVIIDGLFSDPTGRFDSPSSDVVSQIIAGTKPYDNISVDLITHAHPDHFDPISHVNFLSKNKNAVIITTPQAADSMQIKSDLYGNVANRVITNSWSNGWKSSTIGPVVVSSAYTRHAGKAYGKVEHQIFLIKIGNKKVLHIADTQMEVSYFDDLRLIYEDIDIAIVPFWFLTNLFGEEIIEKHVAPKKIVGMHLPSEGNKSAVEKINQQFPKAIVFNEPGQQVSF